MNQSNEHLPFTGVTSIVGSDYLDVVLEYCRLASKAYLSELEADRLNEILELSKSDGILDFWLDEADHFIAHELNLTNEKSIYQFENQLAYMREHLVPQFIDYQEFELFEELQRHIKDTSQELQQHLRNRGFDPGPIDGVLGPRTHSALIAFQQANRLIPNGLPDEVTREALGLN
jgi:Putative peptidoglycan binding domain